MASVQCVESGDINQTSSAAPPARMMRTEVERSLLATALTLGRLMAGGITKLPGGAATAMGAVSERVSAERRTIRRSHARRAATSATSGAWRVLHGDFSSMLMSVFFPFRVE